jgi:hypothetical protein
MRGNDKNTIVDALISPNNNVWRNFTMHPLSINMRLHEVSSALLHGDQEVTDDEWQQSRYANMLIDVGQN